MSKFLKLSRFEMKNVLGGKAAPVICTWAWDSSSGCANVPSTTSCGGSVTDCQTAADTYCSDNDCCTDVDCR